MFCQKEFQDCSLCHDRLCEVVLNQVSSSKVVRCNRSEIQKNLNRANKLAQAELFRVEGGVVN